MFRYDRRIAASEFSAAFADWRDRLLLAVSGMIAIGALRSALNDAALRPAMLVTAAAGLWIGWAAARAIAARIGFHAGETMFAGEALDRGARRAYALAWHGAALAMLAAAIVAVRWRCAPMLLGGYSTGWAAASLAGRSSIGSMPGARSFAGGDALTKRLRRAGGMVAAILSIAMPAVLRAEASTTAMLAAAALFTGAAMLMLAPLDAGSVRFTALAGRGAGWSLTHFLGAATLCGAVQGAVAWIVIGDAAALAIVLTGVALLSLLAAHVLLYRLHAKRPADVLMTVLLGIAALIGLTFLPLLALFIPGALAGLYGQAHRARWMTA